MSAASRLPPYTPQEVPSPPSHRRKAGDARSQALRERSVRRSLVLLGVVPGVLVTAICVAAALAVFHGSLAQAAHPTGIVVAAGALVLICCVVVGAVSYARSVHRAAMVRAAAGQAALSRFAVHGHTMVTRLLEQAMREQPVYQRGLETSSAAFGASRDSLIPSALFDDALFGDSPDSPQAPDASGQGAPDAFEPAPDSVLQQISTAQHGAEAAALELARRFHDRVALPAVQAPQHAAEHGMPRPFVGQLVPTQDADVADTRGHRDVQDAWEVRGPRDIRGAQERHAEGDRRQGADGSAEQFEVFANLSHRLQSLVHREIGLLDELENEIEDPDLLKSIFQVDHLATRIRRYAENLAVLGGAAPSRQWTRSISIGDVLRSAVAEVEQYARVRLVPPLEGTVRGHAVIDVVHLLAELVENATMFSSPETEVLLRAERVTAGLAIEVEDRGLGMEPAERAELNRLLSDPEEFVLGDRLLDGRIGLYVVSSLAWRHGTSIQLQGNIYGGTQAVLVLPPGLQGEEPAGAVSAAPGTNALQEASTAPTTPTAQAPQTTSTASTAQPPQSDQAPDSVAQSRTAQSTGAPQRSVPVAREGGVPEAREGGRENGNRLTSSGLPSRPTHRRASLSAERPPLPEHQLPGFSSASNGSRSSSSGVRPVLPTRVRQESLAPELRRPPAAPAPPADAAPAPAADAVEHSPGLMAAFLTGARRAAQNENTGAAGAADDADDARDASQVTGEKDDHGD